MGEHRTEEQTREDYSRAMGSDLGQLHFELYKELVWLHYKWHQYRVLFGKNAERVDLLNQAAPLFFRIVQDALFDDVLLHLARLTDPPRSVGRDNLTIRRLPALIPGPPLSAEIGTLLDAALNRCDFARKRRNQKLAHTDRSITSGAVPVTPASRHDVEMALKALRDLLNRIEGHFRNAEVGYDLVLDHGGAEELICCLENGIHVEKERQQERRKRFRQASEKPGH